MKRQSAAAQDARGGIAGLAGEITGFGAAATAASSKSTTFQRVLAGINLATGVLEPAMAGVVVAVGGLAAGFAAAGAGLGVFGAVAKTVFTEASKGATAYAAAQTRYASATTSAQRVAALKAEKAAFAGMSPAVKSLALQLGDTQKRWKAFTTAAAPGVTGVISKGLGLLPKILASMKPFLAPVEKALRGIIGQLNTGLSSAGFKSFTDAMAKNTGPAITRIARAIGNVIVGIGGILKAFLPTSQSLLSGLDKITAKFRVWGTTLSGHTGFASLMATFRAETPQAVAILRNLGAVIANVGKAMFGLSTFSNSRLLLSALLPLSGVMASLSRNTDLVRVALYALAAVKIGQQFSWVRDAWKGIVKFAAVTEGATAAEVIAAAATRAWGIAMAALPWVALAAAVVAVAVLIIKYHTQIWNFMKRVWNDILGFISGVWHWVQQNWPLLLGIITGPVGLAILWVVQHFGTITTAVNTVLTAVKTAWNTAWGALKTAFGLFIVNGILTPLGYIITGAATAFGWIPGLGGKLKTAATAFNTFKDNVNKAFGLINGRTVNVSVAMTSSTNPYPGGISGRKAAGGRITGPGGPRSDTAGLFALSSGEWVIRADSAARYGLAAMDAVNRGDAVIGYAAGGGVNVKAGTPSYKTVETSLMASVTKLAIVFAKAAQAAQAAAQAGSGVSGAGPAGGDRGTNLKLARSMFPWPASQWPAFNTLEMHEAGYDRFARNRSSGAYGIPQALPPTKMPFAAQAAGGSHAGPQLSWMFAYIRGRYGTPANAWAQYYAHPGGVGWYAKGGLVPGFASGGTVGQQGAAYLRAWRTRHGGGFGAAHGPVVLNEQIARMSAAAVRAQALAGASGLSPGQHRFWASAAAGEKKRLAVLHKELTTERAWRYQLELNELGLDREIRAAGNIPSLAGPVKGWKAALGRDKIGRA